MGAEAVPDAGTDARDAWIRKRFRACQRFRMQVLMLEMRGCGSG